jgi:tRNA nucleotidyltransferase (CCA-adding enzyme)
MWPHVLPELDAKTREETIAAVDRLPRQLAIRLARLLLPVAGARTAEVEAALDALKPSRELRTRVLALVSPAAEALVHATDAAAIRTAAAALGRAFVDDALAVREHDPSQVQAAIGDAALTTRELAIKGGELIAAGLLRPGPQVSATMDALLRWVLEDPTRNTPDGLLARARAMTANDGRS